MRWSPRGLRAFLVPAAVLASPAVVSMVASLLLAVLVVTDPAPTWPAAFRHVLLEHDSFRALKWISGVAAGASLATGMAMMLTNQARVLFAVVNAEWAGLLLWAVAFPGLLFAPDARRAESIAAGLAVGALMSWFAIARLRRAQGRVRLTSNTDLLKQLRTRMDPAAIRKNVDASFVTTASLNDYWDPFRRHYHPSNQAVAISDTPATERRWLAEYRDLCTLSKADAVRALKATSALPYVFTNLQRQGRTGWVADGGLADNIPVLPVLSTNTDVIVIVVLDPADRETLSKPATLEAFVAEQATSQWVGRLGRERATALYQRFMTTTTPDAVEPPQRTITRDVIIVGPDKPLSLIDLPVLRFITGTLNTGAVTRRRWYVQGFRDAWRVLRRLEAHHIKSHSFSVIES